MKDDLKALLRNEIENLGQARDALMYSYERCRPLTIEAGMDNGTMERFEALTARFARLSDIMIQKVFRTLDALDLEGRGTVRDRINRAEKRGVIQSADEFVEIRMVRNEIAHEYKRETILEIFERVLSLTPKLMDAVEGIEARSETYLT
ncbi:MAG: hypothetical protein P8165_02850 [Deltaproteobacteria bacterium]|jgi:hypothetical protein